ncbi:MAG: sulfatase-like hydrolase/transferase [Lentisphaerae bacterium]|jgi:choline-sulfatase|nr:sulfatase-like hydrolase/transferase [Lentisphaerota bacterium]MBT5609235.1 sulfatase-like hydrolase/transferase [Lentisphaerota bacterium]MBT7059886.1 sulfatase-like hydrolase/transferase [Lentisphaerota bacterium]MBT7847119.1 sulfatase-like hydrolase/transferase [Lentisphaerota bacterium]
MKKRPNILFLMSDEHRPDVVGYEGDAVVRTPVLDELARTGTVFRNAYTPSPICVPSRQCMMAGQLPKTCGCEGWTDLKPGYLTFSRLFSRYAYRTVCCGKLHHQGFDQMQGWTDRPAGDIQVSAPHIEGKVDAEFKKHQRPFGDFKWSDAKEVKRAGVGVSHLTNWDQEWTDTALRFVEEYFNNAPYDREQTQPIMLKVSLVQPHYPYQADAEKFGYYLNRVTPFLDEPVSEHPFLRRRQVVPGTDALERELRRATAAYYGMIETIDSHYGRVIDALRYVGQDLDDWIIVYTTDHGEMLGEHGIWEKQKFYEASARVPLIVRWPKRFAGGKVVQENVNLCDLFATLCELCDIPCPSGLDSRSLVPLMEGDVAGWDNETVSQFGPHNVMIKQGDLKYQYYGPDMPEVLFDLARDPREREDVISDPGYSEQVARFRRRLAQLGHGPNADTAYTNAGYPVRPSRD